MKTAKLFLCSVLLVGIIFSVSKTDTGKQFVALIKSSNVYQSWIGNKTSLDFGILNLPGPLKKFVGGGATVGTLSADSIISATNTARMQNGGLPPLTYNSNLTQSSSVKVSDLFFNQYFEHVSPAGISIAELATQAGYEYILVGENLALGNFESEQAIVDAWMASPGHRANILNDRYTEIGVSVEKGMYEGQEVFIAVQHFGLPLSSCPKINTGLKDTIVQTEKSIADLESKLQDQKELINTKKGNTAQEVATYNELVDQYNQIVSDLKIQIAAYNLSVVAFNTCLAG